jgi:fructose-1,6-bisphosphatase II
MRSELFRSLLKVTEKAALAAAPLIGNGDKIAVDQAAVDAMRKTFSQIDIGGRVVVGEGEKDEAPSFMYDEQVGRKKDYEIDLAIDPIEGTEFVAENGPNAVAVLAAVEKGKLLQVPDIYMDKIIVGPEAKGKISLEKSPSENVKAVAKAKGKDISEITVVVLDRPRHQKIVEEVEGIGANIKLIPGVDVIWGIAVVKGMLGIDMLLGSGGAPEGILTAAAVKCLDGDMEAELLPETDEEFQKVNDVGINDVNRIFDLDDLISGEEILFSLTGVTDGILVDGVKKGFTNSILLRKKASPGSYIREIKTDYATLKEMKVS